MLKRLSASSGCCQVTTRHTRPQQHGGEYLPGNISYRRPAVTLTKPRSPLWSEGSIREDGAIADICWAAFIRANNILPYDHIPRRKRKRPNFRDILYLDSSLINIFCTTFRKNKLAKLKKNQTTKALSIATYWAWADRLDWFLAVPHNPHNRTIRTHICWWWHRHF